MLLVCNNIFKSVPAAFRLPLVVGLAPPLSTTMTLKLKVKNVRGTSTYKSHENSRFMQKLLNKKGAKTKRQWYKPHLGESLEVETKKTKKGISHAHSVRLRQLSHVLYDKIIEIINTGELSDELLEKQVSITAVKMTKDMNNVNVYWEADRNDWQEVEHLLSANSGKLRSLLISYHVLGRIPHIVFVRDKSTVNLHQLTELFEQADYGPGYVPGRVNDANSHVEQDEDVEKPQSSRGSSTLHNDSIDPSRLIENENLKNLNKHFNHSLNLNEVDHDYNVNSETELRNLMHTDKGTSIDDSSISYKNTNTDALNSDISTNNDLHFRSDLYGLDRDEMMKKILAKKSKSSKNNEGIDNITQHSNFGGNDLAVPSLDLDIDPKEIPTLVSPVMEKLKLRKKLERRERRMLEKMLERDSVDF